MFEVGRLVIKIAGRDAGKTAVVVDVLDKTFVLIDGETRRRKVNVLHLEPMGKVIEINKNASHEDVKSAFAQLGLKVKDTKPKEKKAKPKVKKVKRVKKATIKKAAKKIEKKAETLESKTEMSTEKTKKAKEEKKE